MAPTQEGDLNMRIYLVRHGESLGNLDISKYQEIPDFAMPLSLEGHRQARRAGDFLAEWFKAEKRESWQRRGQWAQHPRMWISPYERTRQTADGVGQPLLDNGLLKDRREHVLLAEQQFGLLDGIAGEKVGDHYPKVDARYKLYKEHGGKFWDRPPSGESRFDVCQRVHGCSPEPG